MILALAMLLWSAAFAVATRMVVLATRNRLQGHGAWLIVAVMTIGAALLLFRPHEDFYGGEDPGSYLNSAFTYARTGAFFHTDHLLLDVPSAYRRDFFYGHQQFGLTKDACLWVRDSDNAIIGPRFLPAYPLLMSALVKLGLPRGALYVTPFFAFLTALALAMLAAQLFPGSKLMPFAAPFLYLLCPLIFWHGRCPRPELPASFFLFAGAFFMLRARHDARRRAWIDLLFAGVCVGLSPFFHPTAWQLAIPLCLLSVLVALLEGRDDFAIYPLIAAAFAALFLAQQFYLTDAYRVLRNVSFIVKHPAIAAIITFFACAALWGAARLLRRKFGAGPNAFFQIPQKVQWSVRFGLLGLTILFFAITILARAFLSRHIPALLAQYLVPADFAALSRMISLPVILFVLLGWMAWWLDPDANLQERSAIGLAVMPALLFSGLVVDFMSTRYYVLSIIPLAVMALCGLLFIIQKIELRRMRRPVFSLLLLAMLAVLQVNGRAHLLTLVEHEGFYSFLEDLARKIERPNALLLAEYSRIAAPFEHLFGIPTLGLDQQRRNSYENAEWSWELIMRRRPEAHAFFLTPFQPPTSDRFFFEHVATRNFARKRLQQARLGLPVKIREDTLSLALYRMSLRHQPGANPPLAPLPQSRIFAESNMGLRGFGATLHKDWQMNALMLAPNEPLLIAVPASTGTNAPREALIICNTGNERSRARPPQIEFDKPLTSYCERWGQIQGPWWALQFAGADALSSRAIWLRARDRIAVADILFLSNTNIASAMPLITEKQPMRIPLGIASARCAENNASFFMPAAGSEPTIFLALLAQNPKNKNSTALNLFANGKPLHPPLPVAPGPWQWRSGLLPDGALASDLWIHTDSNAMGFDDESVLPQAPGPFLACFAVFPLTAPGAEKKNSDADAND